MGLNHSSPSAVSNKLQYPRIDSGYSMQEPFFSPIQDPREITVSDRFIFDSMGVPLHCFLPTECSVRLDNTGITGFIFKYKDISSLRQIQGNYIGKMGFQMSSQEHVLKPREGEIITSVNFWSDGAVMTALELGLDSGRFLLAGKPIGPIHQLHGSYGFFLSGFEGTTSAAGYVKMMSAYQVPFPERSRNTEQVYFQMKELQSSQMIGQKASETSYPFDDLQQMKGGLIRLSEIILFFDASGLSGLTLLYLTPKGEKIKGGSSETEEPNNLEYCEFKKLSLDSSERVLSVSGFSTGKLITHLRFSTSDGRVIEAGKPLGHAFNNLVPKNSHFVGVSGFSKAKVESIMVYFAPI